MTSLQRRDYLWSVESGQRSGNRTLYRQDDLIKYHITPDNNGIVVDRKAKSAFSDNERLEFNFTKTMDQDTTQEQAFSYFKTQYIKE